MSNHSLEKKPDRRVVKTRKAIMDAFNRLVSQGDYTKITVSAIAREADIDRKTFYLHYNSIDELAHRKAEKVIERVLLVLREQEPETTDEKRLQAILGEVNRILTQEYQLFSNIAHRLSADQMLAYFEQAAGPALQHLGIPNSLEEDEDLRRRLHFYIAGAWSLYASWLTSPRRCPIEEISDTIQAAVMSAPEILKTED